jgi:hypothetical protein
MLFNVFDIFFHSRSASFWVNDALNLPLTNDGSYIFDYLFLFVAGFNSAYTSNCARIHVSYDSTNHICRLMSEKAALPNVAIAI